MRVVIADDSDFILDRLNQMLVSMEQVKVVGRFHNGIDALNGLRELKPDLAILDNKMPGLRGVEIIRDIRKENAAVRLILLTLYADYYHREEAMTAGADYFFSNSEDFEYIPTVVSELVNDEKAALH
ncbi:response regulator transcription factor [Mariniphaga sediminis]|uniref:response regulator transcription factor n=1 Tax=Mariniphaga sediminis TaxID=1628158 RepID=UPI0035612D2C